MRSSIANVLKSRRKELGLSIREVLGLLRPYGIDISDKTLYGWESGHRQPDADHFIVLCTVYGIESLSAFSGTSKSAAPAGLSEEAHQIAKDYDGLDQPGRNVVKVVVVEEGKRVKADKERRRLGPVQPRETRFIPLYYTPAAAGYMEPAEGEDFEYLEVGPEVPGRADCAIKISGKSMEPYIKDKAIVYVSREPIENGDIGIFCIDGDMLCKQYYRDGNGHVRLLSLNRDYADADRFIHARDNDTIMTYYGKVLMDERPRIVV